MTPKLRVKASNECGMSIEVPLAPRLRNKFKFFFDLSEGPAPVCVSCSQEERSAALGV